MRLRRPRASRGASAAWYFWIHRQRSRSRKWTENQLLHGVCVDCGRAAEITGAVESRNVTDCVVTDPKQRGKRKRSEHLPPSAKKAASMVEKRAQDAAEKAKVQLEGARASAKEAKAAAKEAKAAGGKC